MLLRNLAVLRATSQGVSLAEATKRCRYREARKVTLYSRQRRRQRRERKKNKIVLASPWLVRNPLQVSSTTGRAQSKSRYSRSVVLRYSKNWERSLPAETLQRAQSMAREGKRPYQVYRCTHDEQYLHMQQHPNDTILEGKDRDLR